MNEDNIIVILILLTIGLLIWKRYGVYEGFDTVHKSYQFFPFKEKFNPNQPNPFKKENMTRSVASVTKYGLSAQKKENMYNTRAISKLKNKGFFNKENLTIPVNKAQRDQQRFNRRMYSVGQPTPTLLSLQKKRRARINMEKIKKANISKSKRFKKKFENFTCPYV